MTVVFEIDGKLLALDLKSESLREAVMKVDDGGVKELFKQLAGAYN